MERLQGKKILLGISGGIAVYKACELLRALQKNGAEVRVAMTQSATDFVGTLTFEALSGYPIYLIGKQRVSAFDHIDYVRWADLMVIAPATANTLAKLAQGMGDDAVSLSYLSKTTPCVLVPAMNVAIWESPTVQRNLQQLRQDGNQIVIPGAGRLACGEEGMGRFPELSDIVDQVLQVFQKPQPVKGRVLITAGRTEEPIDPVRYITNRSSGKTACAIASAFLAQGWDVQMVAGPMDLSPPAGVHTTVVRTAREMHQAVLERQGDFSALVFCAAVADFRPLQPAEQKIKESRHQLELKLTANPNILRDCAQHRTPGQILVGFALETNDVQQHAQEKLEKSGADLMILNTPVRADSGFGHDQVEYSLFVPQQPAPEPCLGSKQQLAEQIVAFVEQQQEKSA